MELIVPLLGKVNANIPANAPLKPKYVVRVTAEQISSWLSYDRKGKQVGAPFKLTSGSLIKIDKEIQRGTDEQGFLSQQPAKVREIAQTLLGIETVTVPRLYLGALVWNVRPPASLEVMTMSGDNKPPEYRLRIDTDSIYLTDSAHRHLGIAEAFRAYTKEPDKYPKFKKDFEFTVELYNLDKVGEKELFNELNSKQKRISAAKQKELDVSSPIGALKDAILDQDVQSHRRLFANNIEVASNQNDKQTLMTMSVFVASIGEMFEGSAIKNAREDAELRNELAEYYCQFSYKLSDTLVVRADADGDGKEEEVHPYSNLWLTHIKPVEDDGENPDTLEQRLEDARRTATERNKALRKLDIANHNAVVKAMYRLGGLIRNMKWERVIDHLQNGLNASMHGHFFQKANQDWFNKVDNTDIPIASLNTDGSINVQVQSKNIDKIYEYLRTKLELNRPVIALRKDGASWNTLQALQVSRAGETSVSLRFQIVSPVEPSDQQTTLAVKPSIDWKQGTFTGAKKLQPANIAADAAYVDKAYDDLQLWNVSFDLKLPACPQQEQFTMALSLEYPQLGGELCKQDFPVTVFPV